MYGPGTLSQRLDLLQRLGVDVVRLSIRWNVVAPTQPKRALSANDPAYRWGMYDSVLNGLTERRITPVVTLLDTPGWANGDSSSNVAPRSASNFADFAYAAAKRYAFVRDWTVWNEPNQRLGLSVPSPRLYVTRLLNPAYVAIHRANRRALVAGGVTAPRGKRGRCRPARVDPRDESRAREARRVRPPPVSVSSGNGDAVPRRLLDLRHDHDGEPRPPAAGGAP